MFLIDAALEMIILIHFKVVQSQRMYQIEHHGSFPSKRVCGARMVHLHPLSPHRAIDIWLSDVEPSRSERSILGYFFCHNRPGTRFWLSALQLVRICSFCRSWRILICSFSESRRGFSLTFEISGPNSSETSLPVLTWPTDYDWLEEASSREW